MTVRAFIVKPCERHDIQYFVEQWHYSHSINGVMSDYCFKLLEPESKTLIGAMIYGHLAMASVWKKYAENYDDLLELRRLCCIDDTPRNTESYFIGSTLRWLAHNTMVKTIISYADPNHGHAGIIYQASNFEYLGVTAPSRIIMCDGKSYHDKTIRTKYNGKLKPYSERIKQALVDGDAEYVEQMGKHIYLYQIKRKPGYHVIMPSDLQERMII